jgi:hypothetical protein
MITIKISLPKKFDKDEIKFIRVPAHKRQKKNKD